MASPEQTTYWDNNLDPANRDAVVKNARVALAREVKFARLTPDVCAMIDYVADGQAGLNKQGETGAVLDIGAGLGVTTLLLSERGLPVVAMDISHRRLASLRTTLDDIAGRDGAKVFVVKARAEALPFRDECLAGACSRAVLIHTEIAEACVEVGRVLQAGAPVAFSEVMAKNPLANLYRRTLAPQEWRHITRYFTAAEISLVRAQFTSSSVAYYYVSGFAAFVFQYALPSARLFSFSLRVLFGFDRILGAVVARYWDFAWFGLITGKSRRS